MTNEKAQKIVELLNADEAAAKELLEMQPEDAAKALKEKGIDCTADELVEFAEGLKKARAEGGELNAEDLDDVAGGSKFGFYAGLVLGAGLAAVATFAPW